MKSVVEADAHKTTGLASGLRERGELIAAAGAGLLHEHMAVGLERLDAQRDERVVRDAHHSELDTVGGECGSRR